MSLSDALGAAGPGRKVAINGKELTIKKITQGQKAEFAEWFRARMEAQVMKRAAAYRKQAIEVRKQLVLLAEKEANPETSHQDYLRIRDDRAEVSREAATLEMEAREVVKQFDAEVASEMYEFDGEACRGVLATSAGGYKATWILLKANHPEITEAEVVQMYESSVGNAKALHDAVQWSLGFSRGDDDRGNVKSPDSMQEPAQSQALKVA